MAQDDFITRGDSDGALNGVRDRVLRLEGQINGPPYPGLERKVDRLIDSIEAVEIERAKVQKVMHEQNQAKMEGINVRSNVIIAFAAVVTILLSILLYLHGKDAVNKGTIKLPFIGQVYTAQQTQDTKLPSGYVGK